MILYIKDQYVLLSFCFANSKLFLKEFLLMFLFGFMYFNVLLNIHIYYIHIIYHIHIYNFPLLIFQKHYNTNNQQKALCTISIS